MGSGKSTISTTLANKFRDDRCLGAFLFFSRDVKERSDPAVVVRTLAFQLGSFSASMRAAISQALTRNLGIVRAPIRLQFRKLVVEPLLTLFAVRRHTPIVVILDALDECGNPTER